MSATARLAGVANAGSIQAGPGGFVGLIGGTVSNSGVVSVPLGKVAMGSGEQATLNLTGDNFLQVAVPTNTKTADGRALVDVSGKVSAAGGSVQLKAATVARAIRDAVNVPGELTVGSARASGGSIILSGGPGGDVSVSGKLAASGLGKGGTIAVSGRNAKLNHATLAASSAGGQGGSVIVTGTNAVSLASTAVDASGATGGGAIRIGGDFHGASDLTSAQTTTIELGLDAQRERHELRKRRNGRRVVERSHLRPRRHLGARRPTGRRRRSGRDLGRDPRLRRTSRSTLRRRTAKPGLGWSIPKT